MHKQISRFKAEKELKVRNLVAKIHKERDINQRLEKKVIAKTQELSEMKVASKKEIERLSEILRVELLDRKQAELDVCYSSLFPLKKKKKKNQSALEILRSPLLYLPTTFLSDYLSISLTCA